MPTLKRPRHGSLQFWPRKRAAKVLPSIHWDPIIKNNDKEAGKILGFIAYKAGMRTAFVKDLTAHSMTKDKRIVMPVTILELPTMKVYSIRFHKAGRVITEVLSQHLDKELKKKVKLPKAHKSRIEEVEKGVSEGKYDKITIIAYSIVKKTGIKKTPDMAEIAIGGGVQEQFNFAKTHLDKEIKASEAMHYKMVDARGVTTGKGLTGPLKRYGLELKQHKSEKGRRRPGSLAPWHPARTTYMSPNAGQMGLFTRAIYNNQVIMLSDITKTPKVNPSGGLKNYGTIRGEFAVLRGSVQGPVKRALIITAPLRKTKKQEKKKYEFIELR